MKRFAIFWPNGDEILGYVSAASPSEAVRVAAAEVAANGFRAEIACRVCGCTDSRACDGGCTWIEEDLCSVCAREAANA